MNKRFSTLLAAALVAGGLSASATDAYNGPSFTPDQGTKATVADKEQVLLSIATDVSNLTASSYLQIVSGSLAKAAKPATLAGYKNFTWAVSVKATASGVVASDPVYTFTNKAQNQVLRVKLETDDGKAADGTGKSAAAAKISGDGNAEWGWRDKIGLYAQKGDSTFYFDVDMKLCAVKGGVDKVTKITNYVTYVPMTVADKVALKASDFTTILKNGKVYFNNGKDVKNAKNILTDNAWVAYENNDDDAFFLAVKDKETNSANPYLLMVDTAYYDTVDDKYHALVADTLTLSLTEMAALKGGTYDEATYNPTDLTKYARPIAAATFTGNYYPMNDSIVLTVAGEPTKNYKSAIIDGSKQYGPQVADDAAVTGATATDIIGYTEADGVAGEAPEDLATAVAAWFTDAIKANGATTGYDKEFAKTEFTSGAIADGGTVANAVGGVLTEAQAWVKDEANKDNANLAKIKAFVAAAEKLQRVAAEAAGTAFFVKGLPQRAAGSTAATIALRELSDTKVLTVAAAPLTGYIQPLVQPYKTAPDFGGTADVDVTKVYYLKDLNKYRNNAESKGEGLFFNENPVAQSEYLGEGQAFNPYSQYVFVKTPGTAKGSYTILNRGTGLAPSITYAAGSFSGLTDTLNGDSIVIGGDSLMLVDANIAYTGKDAEKQIGYKFASEYDLVNKSFMIHSASPYMKDLYLHMKSDSSILVAADEVLYNLEAALTATNYGAEVAGIDTLEYQPYFIKTAKGEYLVQDEAGKGYILTKDKSKYEEEITYTNAAGETPKYKAVKTAFFFIATDDADTYVMAEATPENESGSKVKKLVYELSDQKATVNAQSGILESSDKEVRNDLFYVATEPTPASLFTDPKHVQLKAINGDLVAVGKENFGAVAREGDLKAAYAKADFTFWLDTARYRDNEGKDLVTPSYYLTKGIAAVEGTEDAEAVAAKRLYMCVASDSASAAKVEPEQYVYAGKTRVQFRDVVRYGADSLIVNNVAKADTLKEGKTNIYRFNFLVDKDNAGYYNILNGSSYVQNVNGVLVVTNKQEDALKVAVETADAPTSNEGVEVSEMTIIAGEGNVTIAGAAGKKVVISNILGQVVANTVLSSDNATIAAPQGVVVVAVEGEEAVKAIVK